MKFSFVFLKMFLAVSILWYVTISCLTGISPFAKEVLYSCLDTKELDVLVHKRFGWEIDLKWACLLLSH